MLFLSWEKRSKPLLVVSKAEASDMEMAEESAPLEEEKLATNAGSSSRSGLALFNLELSELDTSDLGEEKKSFGNEAYEELRCENEKLKYENAYLVTAETLLEAKCAALDSRLEEAYDLLKHKSVV